MRLIAGGMTDRGRVRQRNEDAYHISVCHRSSPTGLFLVADGMGGANAGEVASQMAVKAVAEEMEAWLSTVSPDDIAADAPEALASAVLAANRRVYESAKSDQDKAGMGTTLTAALVVGEQLIVAHIGDSRGFLVRGKDIHQFTVDHSVVAELVRNGTLTEQQAVVHPHRNILTRALGTDASLAVDLYTEHLRSGDVVLLCSDGVTRELHQAQLLRTVMGSDSPQEACDRVVAAALANGGADNLTTVIFKYMGCDR